MRCAWFWREWAWFEREIPRDATDRKEREVSRTLEEINEFSLERIIEEYTVEGNKRKSLELWMNSEIFGEKFSRRSL